MSKSAKVTILGCGGSAGVPSIGNFWGNCDPQEPKNRRTRSSIAVQTDETTLIIDTGADFREQINREDIKHVDAVLYTHTHSDHVSGMDDLRLLAYRRNHESKQMPIYGARESLDEIQTRFKYLFEGGASEKYYPPVLKARDLEYGKRSKVGDLPFQTFAQDHGTCTSMGFRFGNFGYSVDIYTLDSQAVEVLKGIDIWVVDAAGYQQTDNSVHANLDEIYRLNAQIGAGQVYLTSLTPVMDYQTLLDETPDGYAPAYDGLNFTAAL